jgi:hypothetical protein
LGGCGARIACGIAGKQPLRRRITILSVRKTHPTMRRLLRLCARIMCSLKPPPFRAARSCPQWHVKVSGVSTKRKICVKEALKNPCAFGSIDLHRGNFLGNFEPLGGFIVNCNQHRKGGGPMDEKRSLCDT